MKRFFVLTMAISFVLGACKNTTQQLQESAGQILNEVGTVAEKAVEDAKSVVREELFAGVYQGVIPCADCKGIKSALKLNADGTYEFTQTYLGKERELPHVSKGKFVLDKNVIKLEGLKDMSNLFRIEINQIRYLNADGSEVKGELAGHYILTRE